jgi:5'-methylthioadenosine phosphorylase
VTVEMIINYLHKNVANAKNILKLAIPQVGKLKKFSAADALKFAIITNRDLIPAKIKKDLKPIIGKYIQ